jgi:hypothetical protein
MAISEATTESAGATDGLGADLARRLAFAWLAPLLLLGLPALTAALTGRAPRITVFFLTAQDLGVLALGTAVFALIWLPVAQISARRAAVVAALAERRGALVCVGLCALAAVVGFAGWFIVCRQYPLSQDEFWAATDAKVFQRGVLLPRIAPEWRAYSLALQPKFQAPIAHGVAWGSFYLPVNAGFRALFAFMGSQALAGPVFGALSIATVFGLARRYWPHRPDAALVAALLLATSSQLVVTAMTPYAMSAHLALNLAWLWLFQRQGSLSQVGAVVVAFLATGLHQLIFHPLFAAPFVLQLWLARRLPIAVFHTLAYAAICTFWASYWGLLLHALDLQSAATAAGRVDGLGLTNLFDRAFVLAAGFQPGDPALMAMNLVRFVAWQNPLAVAFGVLGAVFCVRERQAATWPLLAGVVLTTLAMLIIMPWQGHGWGYRYLHGLLGSLCLLAAFAWVRLVDAAGATARRAWAALAIATSYSVLLALPIRAWQAAGFVGPYATAYEAIERSPAQVVIVDPSGLWYGVDLVRNDPFLSGNPKVMDIEALSADQVRALCATRKIAVFDIRAPAASAITHLDDGPHPQAVTLRALMRELGCGKPLS